MRGYVVFAEIKIKDIEDIEKINMEVEKELCIKDWFEDMEDFKKQIRQGFVVLTDYGFNIMEDRG